MSSKFVIQRGAIHGADAQVVVGVAYGEDGLGSDGVGDLAHEFGNGLLLVIAVAAEVVGDYEFDVADFG